MDRTAFALFTLILLGACASTVRAATPQEWSGHDRSVANACLVASGLLDARPVGRPVVFPDSLGYTALTVEGRYPQPHMAGRSGRFLCLFDRRTSTATAVEVLPEN